jgi:hypothetical protein
VHPIPNDQERMMADEIINGLIERQVEPLKAEIERLEAQVERILGRAHTQYRDGVATERERCAQICQAIADDNNRIALHAAVLAALRCRDAIRKGE